MKELKKPFHAIGRSRVITVTSGKNKRLHKKQEVRMAIYSNKNSFDRKNTMIINVYVLNITELKYKKKNMELKTEIVTS